MRLFTLSAWCSLWLLVGYSCAAHAGPRYSVDEFRDNRDGTSTLVITCASGKELQFTIPTKRLNMLDEEGLYQIIKLECK